MITEQTKQYVKSNIAKQRDDGRKLDEHRDVSIETGVIERANGSARVKLGDTEVIVGVKIDVGTPYPDSPAGGVLSTNAELAPLSDPDFEPGRPGEDAVELARVVDRGIRESGTIDTAKLCIKEGEAVWMVFVDAHIVNNGGNLVGACGIGATAALMTAEMPQLNKDNKVDYDLPRKGKLPVADQPIPVVIDKIGKTLVIDPLRIEDKVADGWLMVTTKKNGNLCAMQKGNAGTFTEEEVMKAVDLSQKIGKEIRKKLPK